jgi:hypothetical protein
MAGNLWVRSRGGNAPPDLAAMAPIATTRWLKTHLYAMQQICPIFARSNAIDQPF